MINACDTNILSQSGGGGGITKIDAAFEHANLVASL